MFDDATPVAISPYRATHAGLCFDAWEVAHGVCGVASDRDSL